MRRRKGPKTIPAGEPGSKARGEWDLNRLYDLEEEGRKDKCTYYQVHKKTTCNNLEDTMVLYISSAKCLCIPSAIMATTGLGTV